MHLSVEIQIANVELKNKCSLLFDSFDHLQDTHAIGRDVNFCSPIFPTCR